MKKLRLFDFPKPKRQKELLCQASASQKTKKMADGFSVIKSWLKLWRGLEKYHSIAIFCLGAIALTTVLGHRFYNQPRLAMGTIAPQTITAPYSTSVEDIETTKAERKAARTVASPILKINEVANQQVEAQLQKILFASNESRRIAGSLPFVETSTLSISVQRYLRNCPELEWKLVIATFKAQSASKNKPSTPANNLTAEAIIELQALSWRSPENVTKLINKITQIRQQYAQAKTKLALNPRNTDKLVLELSKEEWKKTQTAINSSKDRILTQGIAPGLPPDIIKAAVNVQLKSPDVNNALPKTAQSWAKELLINVLQPNLIEDVAKTKYQAEQAASSVNTIILEVQQGETIVKAGQEIDHAAFVLLDRFDLSRREIRWYNLLQLGTFVTGSVGVFVLIKRQLGCTLKQRDRILVMLLTLSTVLITTLGFNYTSLPALGLLLGSFYAPSLGFTVIALVTVLLPASLGINIEYLLAGAVGGVLASNFAGKMRSREELALLGVAVGLVEAITFLLVDLIFNHTNIGRYDWRQAGLVGLSGVGWSIVAIGLSPYLEYLFDLVTPIRLAELANPNRPLLKRLATDAPGTFQHTLFVSTLAEAAAKELCLNVELVRAGTFYHDIGKLHDPQGFIENQRGGPNKHDEINNPWLSAKIIIKHVSEGLIMARKYHLPKAVRAFIPEHQGTILVAYFHYQAQQLAFADVDNPSGIVVDERDFRYGGPIPQSPETGIVMLADACEAALRSLKEATYEEALAMVNKILRSRWQDNQMINSGLTRAQMSRIAEIFVEVWLQFHHKRIAYPKAANS